jgi:DNA polymerase-3 subunit epsilon
MGVSSRPLAELCFAVVDVETTGLSPRIENVIELGISVQRGGQEIKSFQSLVGPAVPVPGFITRLTGLRERDLKAAPLFGDIVNAVAHCFVGVDFIVAHNVPFDRAFIEVAFTECRRELPPLLPWVDPIPLARRHLGFAKLGRVAAHYGIPHEHAHRALDDARVTAAILYRLASDLGLDSLQALQTGRPTPPPPAAPPPPVTPKPTATPTPTTTTKPTATTTTTKAPDEAVSPAAQRLARLRRFL